MSILALVETAQLIVAETSSDSDSPWFLLLAGPLGGGAVYWFLFRYYRNTDKSHDFERETLVEAQPITGQERKVDQVRGTKRTTINGNNVTKHRSRVQRLG